MLGQYLFNIPALFFSKNIINLEISTKDEHLKLLCKYNYEQEVKIRFIIMTFWIVSYQFLHVSKASINP